MQLLKRPPPFTPALMKYTLFLRCRDKILRRIVNENTALGKKKSFLLSAHPIECVNLCSNFRENSLRKINKTSELTFYLQWYIRCYLPGILQIDDYCKFLQERTSNHQNLWCLQCFLLVCCCLVRACNSLDNCSLHCRRL